jgi:hypothetical protein
MYRLTKIADYYKPIQNKYNIWGKKENAMNADKTIKCLIQI